MIVSCLGALGLCAYGLGGWVGAIGAILGHVARRQIRDSGEAGGEMALAGIIVGWVATGLFVIAAIAGIIFFVILVNSVEDYEDQATYVMQWLAV